MYTYVCMYVCMYVCTNSTAVQPCIYVAKCMMITCTVYVYSIIIEEIARLLRHIFNLFGIVILLHVHTYIIATYIETIVTNPLHVYNIVI